MDLNQILIWTVCISCVALLMRAKQLSSSAQTGWAIVSGAILLVLGVMILIYPQKAGYSGGLLWCLFVFLPLLGYRHIQQLMSQEQYLQAANQAAFWRWFHPADGWWEQPKILKALAFAQQGELNSAINILKRYQNQNHTLSWLATALVYRMNSQWEELLTWIQQSLPEKVLVSSPDLVMFYLRSLGETGDINKLLQEFPRWKKVVASGGNLRLNLVQMIILAFCGETESVAQLFHHSLRKYPASVRDFWVVTAEMAGGNQAVASSQLLALQKAHPALQKAIKWRLEHGCTQAETTLTPESWQIIQHIKIQLAQEMKYGGALNFSTNKAVATYGLIAINCLIFVWETVAGGNEDEETLYRLGALVPSVVWEGEWWRLLSAAFLHYGILHLSMNMLGLYFLGAYVESTLGIGRYLISYFFSGIGSMLVVTLVAIFTNAPPQITVGASGAIMGMVGALAAILLKGWVIDKAPLAAQRLRSVMFIIGLQTVFDLSNPQVSFLGHISGLVLGFAIASLFVFLLPKSKA
ncbi:rhomboid family intramembrane serine protease [Merismopedia glauca]|uniref:Rhomboid family intramembrane serine protease n=1 Tax=Merismopedia glauca CCAP 1448/3 TaxID=1296344 RepID=A0A2T1C4V6_9CYAN|nr:rhomboid family intramembrane serine protease [Merismopedia glauca]PSB03310.1 rhomboid family intramembrane serine protease [Merismopedia glauca CCAP 1448/3]